MDDHPKPATLRQALYELGCNRLFGFFLHRRGLSGGCLLVLMLFAPDYLWLLLAPPCFLFVALIGYFAAERIFVARIHANRPRCQQCKEVIWQVQCIRCGQRVPRLALLYWGLFLAHCPHPHCGGELSESRGSLLARCHCGYSFPRPRHHFARPTVVKIELSTELPPLPHGRENHASSPDFHEMRYYDSRAFVIYFRIKEVESFRQILDKVNEAVVFLWIGSEVPRQVWLSVVGTIPASARRRAVLWFEGPFPQNEKLGKWADVRSMMKRPEQ